MESGGNCKPNQRTTGPGEVNQATAVNIHLHDKCFSVQERSPVDVTAH